MKVNYTFTLGTVIADAAYNFVIVDAAKDSYRLKCVETHAVHEISMQALAHALRDKEISIKKRKFDHAASSALGGHYTHAQCLPKEQQEIGRLNLCIARAVVALENEINATQGGAFKPLSQRRLSTKDIRTRLAELVSEDFGHKVHAKQRVGGKSTTYGLYQGRTLRKYADRYKALPAGEDPLNFMVTRDHLKGHRKSRLHPHVEDLLNAAWAEVGRDKRKPTTAMVREAFEAKLRDANTHRMAEGHAPLPMPSAKTIGNYRYKTITPLADEIAVNGVRHMRNTKGAGSTDVRALQIGELIEIDECKLSLIAVFKRENLWEQLSPAEQKALKDNENRIRMHLVVALDVASRMPLGWVLTDQPDTQATLAVLRMATRWKTREKQKYGCRNEPMPAIGIGRIKIDNGAALRNAEVASAICDVGGVLNMVRAHNPGDKPHVERLFGTLESRLLKMLPGYTGRKPNDLPAYDAKASGVIEQDELYAMITRFLIDEYPSTPHHGRGMFGRCPLDVAEAIMNEYGCIPPIPAHDRRISLGISAELTPQKIGVSFRDGLVYHSDELQKTRDKVRPAQQVTLYVDPDDLAEATICTPDAPEPLAVALQNTVYIDLTLAEYDAEITRLRSKDPRRAADHAKTRIDSYNKRKAEVSAIEKARKPPRATSTQSELERQTKVVQGGPRHTPQQLPDTWQGESVADINAGTSGHYHVTGAPGVVDNMPDAAPIDVTAPPVKSRSKRTAANAQIDAPNAIIGRTRTIKKLED